jgi:hypothetical protein
MGTSRMEVYSYTQLSARGIKPEYKHHITAPEQVKVASA